MDEQVPQAGTVQHHDNQIRSKFSQLQLQPLDNRSTKDRGSYILFIIITITFLLIGFHFIRTEKMKIIFKAATKFQTDTQYIELSEKISLQNLRLSLPTIVSVILLAVVLSLALLCLLIVLPNCTFIMTLIFGVLAIFGTAGVFLYLWELIPATVCIVLGLILGLIQIFSKKKIKNGINLLQTGSKFIKQTPSILVTPFFMLILFITLQIFWGLGFIGILVSSTDRLLNLTLAILWVLFNLFYAGFLYLCLSFMMATAAVNSFYDLNVNFLTTGIKRILKYHLGSITKATLMAPIVFFGRKHFSGSISIFPCSCIFTCCLKSMKDISMTLNHNAIILISVTGQNYFNSAQTTLSLIYTKFPLYFLVDSLSHLVLISGAGVIAGISGMIGFVLLGLLATNPQQTSTQVVGTIMLFIFGFEIGIAFIGVFSQCLNCMLLLYCIRDKFIQFKYSMSRGGHQYLSENLQKFRTYQSGEHNPQLVNENRISGNSNNNNKINAENLNFSNYQHIKNNKNPYELQDDTDPNTYVRRIQY